MQSAEDRESAGQKRLKIRHEPKALRSGRTTTTSDWVANRDRRESSTMTKISGFGRRGCGGMAVATRYPWARNKTSRICIIHGGKGVRVWG